MNVTKFSLCVLSLGFVLATLAGCSTDSAGVTNTMGSYSAMVDSSPDKVTAAANTAVKEMKLIDVMSNGTKMDGKVTAKNAQNDTVTIDVVEAGQNVSKVTVRIGTTGDEAASKQIIERIRKNL